MKRKKVLYSLLANKHVRSGCLLLVLGSKYLHDNVVCKQTFEKNGWL